MKHNLLSLTAIFIVSERVKFRNLKIVYPNGGDVYGFQVLNITSNCFLLRIEDAWY